MQATKYILSVMLVAAILISGLPTFSPEDASRDNKVDLGDAILQLRDLARTAEEPGDFAANFAASMAKTISTLHLLAGLKTVIKEEGPAKSSANSFCLDLPYLISAYTLPSQSVNYHNLYEKLISHKSIVIIPSLPPPQFFSIS